MHESLIPWRRQGVFHLRSRSQTQDQFMKFAVVPELTEVFVECRVVYLLYQDVRKFADELFTSPYLFLLYIGSGLKKKYEEEPYAVVVWL